MESQTDLPIRLLTHNIRYATKTPFPGEELWAVRKSRLINELRFNTGFVPEAFICLQEVLHEQLQDILSELNRDGEWQYIGVGREDGDQVGEYSPVLYRPSIWQLQEFKTLWLSETPDRPSKGWDAASTRILTVGKFEHHESKKVLVAMNTHLDDQGSRSRLESAKIIRDQAAAMSCPTPDGPRLPVFLTGDLNSEPSMEAYRYLFEQSPMVDVQTMVPPGGRYGHVDTFTGFGQDSSPPKRIDFIFIKDDNRPADGTVEDPVDTPWVVRHYGVLENKFDDGVYLSDHRAVVADLLLR
ncbi:MAG: hypothetical protein Q9187_004370 [Circinaria calcarea]